MIHLLFKIKAILIKTKYSIPYLGKSMNHQKCENQYY